MARDEFKWCVRGVGVQELFGDRIGALRIISQYFDPVALHLRSLPDRCLYGTGGKFHLIEIKALEQRPNVAIEGYQFCYLRALQDWFTIQLGYVFGTPNEANQLEAWYCPVQQIPAEKWYETTRFRTEWPEATRQALELLRNRYVKAEVVATDSDRGSGDPFLTFARSRLAAISTPLREWFEKQGVQQFGAKERIAWEGRNYEGTWRHYEPPEAKGEFPPTTEMETSS